MDPRDPEFGVDASDGTLTFGDGKQARCRPSAAIISPSTRQLPTAVLDGAPVPVDPADARDGLRLIDLARQRCGFWGSGCRSRPPVRRAA